MVARAPSDPRARYFLANELYRAERWDEAADAYRAYLDLEPGDEGVGWMNFGRCLDRTGRFSQAAEAYRRGVASARARHHEGLADEIEDLLAELPG